MTRRHYDPDDAADAHAFGLTPPAPHAPRPLTPTLDVDRRPVTGTCPQCGDEALSNYRVLSEGGWWFVTKCQNCLTTTRRERAELLGPFRPLAASLSNRRKDA